MGLGMSEGGEKRSWVAVDVNDIPPVPGFVKCRYMGACVSCAVDTVWRVSDEKDYHICSKKCYDDIKEVLCDS